MRKVTSFSTALSLCLMVWSASIVSAQEKKSRPSPPAKAECKLPDGKAITVDYSSPRAKGRKIFGDLVPYGQVWRAGANEATTLATTSDITVGGKAVPAGKYTIFAIPSEDKWSLLISKKNGEWGTAYPGPENDLVRVDMKVSKTSSPVENFTIAFDQSGNGCTLRMEWENTRASVEIK